MITASSEVNIKMIANAQTSGILSKIISNMKASRAGGPDGLPSVIFKKDPEQNYHLISLLDIPFFWRCPEEDLP